MSANPSNAYELLPKGVTVFERGWLSSNNIFLMGQHQNAIIDTGYCTHQDQTLRLVQEALQGRPLHYIVNTHLHSDHCGGNAILQQHYADAITLIPKAYASAVSSWSEDKLSFASTGQLCQRFHFQDTLIAGQEIRLGDLLWEVHAAPGHDPDSVILFEPLSRCLISADALWQHGFGVVFPELVEQPAFEAVGQTLDLIESLMPAVVIPGHGSVFSDVDHALDRARQRLAVFKEFPSKHTSHAAKVLLKFKLMELQSVNVRDFIDWAVQSELIQTIFKQTANEQNSDDFVMLFLKQLHQAKVIRLEGQQIFDLS